MADVDGTPRRSKTVKHIRYEQKFKPEYCSEFKFISKSLVKLTRFVCSVDRISVSRTVGGTT